MTKLIKRLSNGQVATLEITDTEVTGVLLWEDGAIRARHSIPLTEPIKESMHFLFFSECEDELLKQVKT